MVMVHFLAINEKDSWRTNFDFYKDYGVLGIGPGRAAVQMAERLEGRACGHGHPASPPDTAGEVTIICEHQL